MRRLSSLLLVAAIPVARAVSLPGAQASPAPAWTGAEGGVLIARRTPRRWRHRAWKKRQRQRQRQSKKQQWRKRQPQSKRLRAPVAGPGPAVSGPLRRGRLTFEDKRVTGQRPQQGAIELIARPRVELTSMVREREAYRTEILRTVFVP
jgi:hypothetical protein